MSAPTRGADTLSNRIHVEWAALSTSPANGGSSVLSYNLQWDSGTNGATWTNLIGLAPPSLLTSLYVTTGVTSG